MIAVTIWINGKPIVHRSAVNVTGKVGGVYGKGEQTYDVDDGRTILHDYDSGAVKLAMDMLRGVVET